MTRIIRLFTIGILSVLLFGVASTQDVLACSGGRSSSINELVSYADVIVRGRIIETDDSYQNGVMQVSEYIKGEGNEFILISAVSPEFISYIRLRYSGGGCFTGISGFPKGREIIIFLDKNFDGSYGLANRNHVDADYFLLDYGIYVLEERFGVRVSRGVEYDEFVNVIQNITKEDTSLPTENNSYPLHAPLFLITKSGTEYIIPVDNSSPILFSTLGLHENRILWFRKKPTHCWNVNCLGEASNHLDKAKITANSIEISYYITETIEGGQGFAFSPTFNGFVATWAKPVNNPITIGIYRYSFDMGYLMQRGVVLDTDTFYPHSGAWSPRGRYLAYADTDGIYLWDVFTPNSSPELLIETNHKMIHRFSPMGRFLMIGNGDTGFSFRLEDGSTHPLGAFSPNDRILLPYQNPAQIIYFLPNYEVATIPLPDELVGYQTEEIVWANNNRFYRLMCHDESCFMAGGDISHRVYTPHPLIQARDFDYDALNDQLVILQDDWHIRIQTPFTTLEYDLSDVLDSPIASIEWLPSLFYYDD